MKTVNLKTGLKQLGYTIVQYNKGYNFRSGFATKGIGFYYFSYEDLRDSKPTLLIRTADPTIKNKKGVFADYHGGSNIYPNLELYRIEIHEPRASCDFNSN